MMGIAKSVIDTVNILVKNQTLNYDRTIQAIVVENNNSSDGEIKVKYQDSILKVYTDKDSVSRYPNGSHVYILIPNNNISGRKTIIGLVESIGNISVVNHEKSFKKLMTLTDSLWWFKTTPNNIPLSNRERIIFEYPPPATVNSDDQLVYPSLDTNIDDFTALFNSAEWFSFTFDIYSYLLSTLNTCNYGLKFKLKYRDNDRYVRNISFIFDIDDFSGSPYCQGFIQDEKEVFQSQEKIFKNPLFGNVENILKMECIFFIEGLKENDITQEESIYCKNIAINSLLHSENEEVNGLATYIMTPNGQTYSKILKNSTSEQKISIANFLPVTGIIKNERVQIDNSQLQCYWFIQDESWTQKDEISYLKKHNYSIPITGGDGWRILNANPSLTYNIERKELKGARQRQIKLISIYKGIELVNTTTLVDLNVEFSGKLVSSGETLINGEEWHSFSFVGGDDIEFLNLKWYYTDLDGLKHYLGNSVPLNGSEIKIQEEFQRYFQLVKDSSRSSRNNLFTTILTRELNGYIVCEVYNRASFLTELQVYINNLESFSIENIEQVFLYNSKGRVYLVGGSDLGDEDSSEIDKYTIATRPLSVINPEGIPYWWVPKNKTMISISSELQKVSIYPSNQERNSFIYPDFLNEENYYRIRLDILPFSISENFKDTYYNNNIILELATEDSKKFYSTHFSFVKEGHLGTANTGYFTRIVPNINKNAIAPPVPIMFYGESTSNSKRFISETFFNYTPKGYSSQYGYQNVKPFKVQLWQGNRKVAESETNENIDILKNIQWGWQGTDYATINQNGFLTINSSPSDLKSLNIDETFKERWALPASDEENDKCLLAPKQVNVTFSYENITYTTMLPIPAILRETSKNIDFHSSSTIEVITSLKRLEDKQERQNLLTGFFFASKDFGFTPPLICYYDSNGDRVIEKDGKKEKVQNNDPWKQIHWGFYWDPRYESLIDEGEDNKEYCYTDLKTNAIQLINKANNQNRITEDLVEVADYYSLIKEGGELKANQNYYCPPPQIYQDSIYEENGIRLCLLMSSEIFDDVPAGIKTRYKDLSFLQIPIITTVEFGSDLVLANWNGTEGIFDSENSELYVEKGTFGTKKRGNKLTGAIIGKMQNEQSGLFVYNEGRKVFSVNEDGKILIGSIPSKILTIDPSVSKIYNQKGLDIDYSKREIQLEKSVANTSIIEGDLLFGSNNNSIKNNYTIGLHAKEGLLEFTSEQSISKNNSSTQWILYKEENNKITLFNESGLVSKINLKDDFITTPKLYVGVGRPIDNRKEWNQKDGTMTNSIHNGWYIDNNSIQNGINMVIDFTDNSNWEKIYRSKVQNGSPNFANIHPNGCYIGNNGITLASGRSEKNFISLLNGRGIFSQELIIIDQTLDKQNKEEDPPVTWSINKNGLYGYLSYSREPTFKVTNVSTELKTDGLLLKTNAMNFNTNSFTLNSNGNMNFEIGNQMSIRTSSLLFSTFDNRFEFDGEGYFTEADSIIGDEISENEDKRGVVHITNKQGIYGRALSVNGSAAFNGSIQVRAHVYADKVVTNAIETKGTGNEGFDLDSFYAGASGTITDVDTFKMVISNGIIIGLDIT